MSDDIKEQLSALIDGELDRDSARFLLRRVETDAQLRVTWSRYQLVRQTLRRQEGPMVADDFAARVMARLADEPAVRAARFGGWLKYASGGAIAAGVAVVALLASRPAGQDVTSAPKIAITDTRPAETVNPTRIAIQPQPAALERGGDFGAPIGIDPRLQSYLIRHYEASGGTGRSGAVPYVLLVVPSRAGTPQGSADRVDRPEQQ